MRFDVWIDGTLVLMFIILMIPSIYNSTITDVPTAEDWNRHGLWIDQMKYGVFNSNYLPVFLLFMLPFAWIFENLIFFQVIFAFSGTITTLYFAYKTMGKTATMLVSIFLASSFTFVGYVMSMTPQALDYIIAPMTFLALLQNRKLSTSLGLIMLLYNHLLGIVFLITALFYSVLAKRDYLKWFAFVIIMSLPAFYFYYLPAILNPNAIVVSSTGRPVTEWETPLMIPITNFFLFSFGMNWVLLPFVIYLMYKQKNFDKKQGFYALWCISIFLSAFYEPYRWVALFVVPFSLFEASVLSKWLEKYNHG